MKSTGIVRKVDELGRIVLPIELRRTLDIAERDELEIYMENDQIILKKYEPSCIFCASERSLSSYKGKNIYLNAAEPCPVCKTSKRYRDSFVLSRFCVYSSSASAAS